MKSTRVMLFVMAAILAMASRGSSLHRDPIDTQVVLEVAVVDGDTGAPIQGAWVCVGKSRGIEDPGNESSRSGFTDELGVVSFQFEASPGVLQMQASSVGHGTELKKIYIPPVPSGTVRASSTLMPKVAVLYWGKYNAAGPGPAHVFDPSTGEHISICDGNGLFAFAINRETPLDLTVGFGGPYATSWSVDPDTIGSPAQPNVITGQFPNLIECVVRAQDTSGVDVTDSLDSLLYSGQWCWDAGSWTDARLVPGSGPPSIMMPSGQQTLLFAQWGKRWSTMSVDPLTGASVTMELPDEGSQLLSVQLVDSQQPESFGAGSLDVCAIFDDAPSGANPIVVTLPTSGGQCEVAGLPPGSYMLTWFEDHGPRSGFAIVSITQGVEPQTVAINVNTLEEDYSQGAPPPDLKGAVRGQVTTQGVGAFEGTVLVIDQVGEVVTEVSIEADGTYVLGGLSYGTYRLASIGSFDSQVGLAVEGSITVEVWSPMVTAPELLVAKAPFLLVTVQDVDDQGNVLGPSIGASVEVRQGGAVVATAQAGTSGQVVFTDLESSSPLTVGVNPQAGTAGQDLEVGLSGALMRHSSFYVLD